MTVDHGEKLVRLSPGEVLEVVLPNGDSVWVRADGTTYKQKKAV